MDVPPLVSETLGDEDVAAQVPLKGEDALFVTPTRTIRYTAEGLLSDESVSEFPHDAECVAVSESRRKATIELDYGTDGTKQFTVPLGELERAVHPVLAGVLNANGVTDPGETVIRTFRFSELTVVVTSDRLIKHVGGAIWDEEFEEIPFADVSDIDVEEGNVSSQFVVKTPGRTQRIKAPNESFRSVREAIEDAILDYHGVDSVAAFRDLLAEEADAEPDDEPADVSFESDVDPVGTVPSESGPDAGSAETGGTAVAPEAAEASAGETGEENDPAEELERKGFTAATNQVEPTVDPAELGAKLDELAESIDEQREVLDRQRAWIEDVRDLIPDR
ncbi:MAG: PH domain-containing protein [Halanaeroarchaeum sp.]